MSKATKRKHVTREVLDDYNLPEEHQQIVKVTASRGNNLHEIQTATGDQFLVSMPTRFRKNIWIKRGDFVIVDPILEGDKVKAEIATILYPKQIKYIQKEGLWPDQFTSKPSIIDSATGNQDDDDQGTDEITQNISEMSLQVGVSRPELEDDDSDSEDDDDDDDLFVNTNRPSVTYYYSDSDDDEEGEDEDGER